MADASGIAHRPGGRTGCDSQVGDAARSAGQTLCPGQSPSWGLLKHLRPSPRIHGPDTCPAPRNQCQTLLRHPCLTGSRPLLQLRLVASLASVARSSLSRLFRVVLGPLFYSRACIGPFSQSSACRSSISAWTVQNWWRSPYWASFMARTVVSFGIRQGNGSAFSRAT